MYAKLNSIKPIYALLCSIIWSILHLNHTTILYRETLFYFDNQVIISYITRFVLVWFTPVFHQYFSYTIIMLAYLCCYTPHSRCNWAAWSHLSIFTPYLSHIYSCDTLIFASLHFQLNMMKFVPILMENYGVLFGPAWVSWDLNAHVKTCKQLSTRRFLLLPFRSMQIYVYKGAI